MCDPTDILQFWFQDCSPDTWFRADPTLDATIKTRFEAAWHQALSGAFGDWAVTPHGALALVILTDQFPRNMFRNSAQAFASDPLARAVAKRAIDRGFDQQLSEAERAFLYLPLEHSECLCDQERAVRLMATRMTGDDGAALLHARAHREIIRAYGRFPFRNQALGRSNTEGELQFLAQGGYGAMVQKVQARGA